MMRHRIKNLIVVGDKQTKALAKQLSKEIVRPEKGALVLALVGNLGAGKTTFAQALIKALGVQKRVLSPTFLVMKVFSAPKATGFQKIYHIDAYRVNSEDLVNLGLKDVLAGKNLVLIEWAENVKDILPKNTKWIIFEHDAKPNQRKITIN